MARSVRKTRKRRGPLPCQLYFNGPSREYLYEMSRQMEIYDDLTPQEAALAQEYGLAATLKAVRQFYGQPDAARKHLEAQRLRLQKARWENI